MKQISILFSDGQEKIFRFDALRVQPASPISKIPDTLILYSDYNLKLGKYENKQVFSFSEFECFSVLE